MQRLGGHKLLAVLESQAAKLAFRVLDKTESTAVLGQVRGSLGLYGWVLGPTAPRVKKGC